MTSAPLDGIIVVSLEQAISAPFATRHLADLGATVIKIERPEGDFARHYDSLVKGQSAFFVWANRGKQSVALDLKDDDDLAVFRSLIAGADVFLHNLSPQAAARLGIDAETLHATHPSLVAVEISGYGHGGPRMDDKAYDLAIQAEAGVFSVTGGEEMSKVGFSVADICSGMYALSSILAALLRCLRRWPGSSHRTTASRHCAIRHLPSERRQRCSHRDSERRRMAEHDGARAAGGEPGNRQSFRDECPADFQR